MLLYSNGLTSEYETCYYFLKTQHGSHQTVNQSDDNRYSQRDTIYPFVCNSGSGAIKKPIHSFNSYDCGRWAGMNSLKTAALVGRIQITERIRESSAATTQAAAHQVATSEHFEAEPLQEGLTGSIPLAGTSAQLTKNR